MAKRTSASPNRKASTGTVRSRKVSSRKASSRRTSASAERASSPSSKRGKATSKSLALHGGRTLRVRSVGNAGRETIELKSADGSLELKITMTPDGPMIHVKGGSLAVEAADSVRVACKRFDVEASGTINLAAGDVSLQAGGELRLRSQGHTHMDSEVLHLNCGDRSSYPPPPTFVMPEEIRELASASDAATNDGCGCTEHHH